MPFLLIYPPAPWRLTGRFLAGVNLIPFRLARQWVPAELNLLPITPGHALGGFLLASYEQGSSIEYHELLVSPAICRFGSKIGIWVSHIYVDRAASQAGGRELFGLPKERAEFEWQPGYIIVRKDNQVLLEARYSRPSGWSRVPLWSPAFGSVEGDLRWFRGKGVGRVGLTRGELVTPEDSPFSSLVHPWITIYSEEFDLQIGEISVIRPGLHLQ